MLKRILTGCAALAMAALTTTAMTATARADDTGTMKFSVSPYTNYAAPTDLGNAGGTINVFRAGATVTASEKFSEQLSGKLAVQGEYSHYGFHNLSAVPDSGTDTFDGEMIDLRPSINYYINDHLALYGGVLLDASADAGARWGNAFTYGGYIGFNYKVGDGFWIGTGIGFSTELEDNPLVLPLFTASWQFADNWTLSADGLSARLTYKIDDGWSAFVDGRYVFRQYRLSASDVIANGAIFDESLPITVGVEYKPTEALSVSASVGSVVYRRVEFWTPGGNQAGADEADPAFFAGLQVSYAF
ncbi:MAG: DUF6268 family outer membrane beta-barrel protein [Tepidisphaeraceae bacterium]